MLRSVANLYAVHRGVWRSLVARSVRVGEVPSSNLGTPMEKPASCGLFFSTAGHPFRPAVRSGVDDARRDRERERSTLELRRHYVEGRLDDTELSERLELVLRARSRRELRIALRQLPRWTDVDHLADRARHGATVAVVTIVWLMLSATLFVTFLVGSQLRARRSATLLAFPAVWIVLSALLYRRMALSRRRLHRQ